MSSQPLFPIGKLVMTRGVADAGFALDALLSLVRRHVTGDFGEINEEDRQENLDACAEWVKHPVLVEGKRWPEIAAEVRILMVDL